MYALAKAAVVKKRNERVVVGNSENGRWVNISNRLYEQLQNDIKSGNDQIIIEKYKQLIDAEILKNDEIESNAHIDTVMLAITNKCNLKCLHCGFEAGPEGQKELPTQVVLDIIKQNSRMKSITITGGEPLVHPGFFEILKCLQETFEGHKTLMTNGILINEKNVGDIIQTFNSVSISMDGASEESCDMMRGKGTYRKIINAVRLMKEKGFNNISLSMTLTDYNAHQEQEFKNLCSKLEVEPMIRDLFIVGRAKKNIEQLDSSRKTLNTNYEIEDIEAECRSMKMNGKCDAGEKSIYIQYDGTVYPCPVAAINPKFKMADVNGENVNLESINSKANSGYKCFRDISPQRIKKCKDCEVNDFCWGCIQEYYTYIEDDEKFENFCHIQKNI